MRNIPVLSNQRFATITINTRPSLDANPWRAGYSDALFARPYTNVWRSARKWRKAWQYHVGYRHGQYMALRQKL